jgi:hypothetical protein
MTRTRHEVPDDPNYRDSRGVALPLSGLWNEAIA